MTECMTKIENSLQWAELALHLEATTSVKWKDGSKPCKFHPLVAFDCMYVVFDGILLSGQRFDDRNATLISNKEFYEEVRRKCPLKKSVDDTKGFGCII